MSVAFPLPSSTRRADTVCTAGQTVFAPTPFLCFDASDVGVYRKLPGATKFTKVTSGYTVTLSGGTLGYATVTMATGETLNTVIRRQAERVHSRLTDVTRAGSIQTAKVERELDIMASVLQELRRDVGDSTEQLSALDAAGLIAAAAQAVAAAATTIAVANDVITANPALATQYTTTTGTALLTIPGGVKTLRTFCHANIADYGGGVFTRASGLPTHYAWFRSVDRLMPDGITIDAINGGYWEMPDRRRLHIHAFGGVCNGIADDTLAINRMIVSLPVDGGRAELEGLCKISAPVYIGNGTSSSLLSSRNGITLAFRAIPKHPAESFFPNASGQLVWAGAAADYMIRVLGPQRGLTLENISLNGQNAVHYGIQFLGVARGKVDYLTVNSCLIHGVQFKPLPYYNPTIPVPIFSDTSDSWLVFNNLNVLCGAASGSTAVAFIAPDPGGDKQANTNFVRLNDTRLIFTDTHDNIGYSFGCCDSLVLDGTLILPIGAMPGHQGARFDYTSATNFPYGIVLRQYDAGWLIPAARQIVNVGAPPATIYGINVLESVPAGNGGVYIQNLPNLHCRPQTIHSQVELYVQTAVQSGTGAIANDYAGTQQLIRVSGYMTMRVAGAAGTVTLVIGWDDGLGAKAKTVISLNATSASACDGFSFAVRIPANQVVTWQTVFTGGADSRSYDLTLSFEQMN